MYSLSIIWSINSGPVLLAIPIFLLLIGTELILHFVQQRQLYRLNNTITNIGCGLIYQITSLFLKVSAISIYQLIYQHLSWFHIPVTWYSFMLLFLLADLLYYWSHRKSHEINLLWKAHEVHHQSEDFNLTVAFRQGALQTLWSPLFYLPLALLGFDTLTFVSVSSLVNLYQFWLHTETIGKLGWLEHILNTPSHHRVHHGRDLKYIDKNHAGVFIIWDKLFGTFQQEEEQPTYGTTEPVRSWNPIWVNIQPYIKMVYQIRQTPRWIEKFRILFNKPGWLPKSQLSCQIPQQLAQVDGTKNNSILGRAINFYMLFQFVSVLIATAFFIFNPDYLSAPEKIIASFLIIATLFSLGLFFDNKPVAIRIEAVRMIATSVALLYFDQHLASTVLPYLLISIPWLLFFRVNPANSISLQKRPEV